MMGAAATGSTGAVEFRRNGIAVTGTLRHDGVMMPGTYTPGEVRSGVCRCLIYPNC
jgi:hypothetical protein